MDKVDIEVTLDKIRHALENNNLPAAISTLSQLHPADLADAFSDLPDDDQATLLPKLNLDATADLLEELEDEEAVDIAGSLTTERLADVLDAMEPDEAADVLGDLPAEIAAQALAEMEDAIEVIPLLGHHDETAGGLMTTSFITLRPKTTAAQAINYLRQLRPQEETPYYLYVVDSERRLIGIVSLRSLLVADPNAAVETFMDPSVIHVTTETDQEDVARLMVRYDLAALPVVDDRSVLWGVITYDDLMDVLEDEATEDIYRLANVADADLAVDSPVGLAVRRRLPWLYLNTLTALFAAWVISNFEDLFTQVAVLAVFQSVVAGMGGNVATQSLALVVRAIALGEISRRQAWIALWKQVSAGVIQGLAVGVVVGLGVVWWKGSPYLGLILGLALFGNMLVAVAAGTIVPLILHAIKLDPALASSIFVTAITDSIGFALFLGLASIFLPYLNG
jgi:magnesium transporter